MINFHIPFTGMMRKLENGEEIILQNLSMILTIKLKAKNIM